MSARAAPRGAGIGLVALAVLLVGFVATAWFLRNFHRVEHRIELPPRGEAAYNPLYALKRALQADGVAVDSRQRLDLSAHAPGPRDTLLLYGDPRSLSPPQARRLLQWVEGGGHLLLRTPAGREDEALGSIALFDALGIVAKGDDGGRGCLPFRVEGETPHVEFCGSRRFVTRPEVVPALAWGDLQHGYAYARLARGAGHVDVLADFDFLHNRGGESLREPTHAALARQLLAPNYGRGTVHLVYAAQLPSLWRTLFTRGWMAWLPLALALCAWLWWRSQRFGPLQPLPAPERRSLLEHVHASGELLYRHGKGALLHAAVRASFLARLRRRDPLVAALDGEAQVEAIARRLPVVPQALRQALQAPAAGDGHALFEHISLLIRLRNQL